MSNETTRVMSDGAMEAADRQAAEGLSGAPKVWTAPEVQTRVQTLLQRPYRMEVRGDPNDGYLASAPELPGCITAGETPEEAMSLLRDAMAAWLEATIIAGDQVPEPSESRYSGRMLLRLPKSLHRRIAETAGRENVSINQLAATLLAEGLGRDYTRELPKRPARRSRSPATSPR